MPINATSYTKGSITGTNYTPGSIGVSVYGSLVRADSTSVTAGSTTVLANGQDTGSNAYKSGYIKSNNWTVS